MTNEATTAAAERLGIKPTRAKPGTAIWQCWADRVQQADMYDDKTVDNLGAQRRVRRDDYIAEANRYAV